jgi:hypothetical protein
MKFLEKIATIDQFGVLFTLYIQGQDNKYKSLSGAIATLFLYSSGLGYFLYLIILWNTG